MRRRASSSTCCAFRSATCPRPRCARWPAQFGLAVADKADSQDICFVPTGRYTDLIARLQPDAVHAGRHRPSRRARARASRGHRQLHGRAAARPRPRRQRAGTATPALSWWGSTPSRARVVVGPRAALATAAVVLRDVNWIGPGTLDAAAAPGGSRSRCGCARRGRPCRRGSLVEDGAVTVRARARRGGRVARAGLRVLRLDRSRTRGCSAAA